LDGTASVGRTPAVRPFIERWFAALSDHPLSTKAAGIMTE